MTTINNSLSTAPAYRSYQLHQLDDIPGFRALPPAIKESVQLASQVFPFKINNYLVDELIDWNNVPDDPIFRLAFPLREMLKPRDQEFLIESSDSAARLSAASNAIRRRLNPNPGDQKSNVPIFEGKPLEGVQHKYANTVLMFPAAGQTCHCHCSFCFRWSQFVGMKDEKFGCEDSARFFRYLASNPDVSDVLFTGGDPLVMSAARLESLVSPLIFDSRLAHVKNIRFGTKALGFWPYRFISDKDSDQLLRLFERAATAGKHVAVMAHFNHPRELETCAVKTAVGRILATGAIIRTQGPLLANINNCAKLWHDLWQKQLALGLVPYYMFMERDTGAHDYFAVPIARALDIYQSALRSLSGLARTVRGPVMSTSPGKIEVLGRLNISGREYFSLRFIRARKEAWEHRQFLADYSPTARWIDELSPALNEKEFFFNERRDAMAPDYQEVINRILAQDGGRGNERLGLDRVSG
ncbi:MAG TPA: hypothetical protein VIW64_07365 [Pyrinomonadaceae bacterium]|jgi:KamA family protein